MKFNDFKKLLTMPVKPAGYMVSWELRENGMLCSQHSPDKHAGEPLIESYNEALEMASKLANTDPYCQKYVNIYVLDSSFCPISETFNRYPN